MTTSQPSLNVASNQPAALAAARKFFEDLAAHNVRYCHWKSNVRLEHGLLGKTDLDLLVDTRDTDLFNRLLAAHKIKRVIAPEGKRYPGVEDHLGFDEETGRLFHLHVHYRLVLGEQFVKNYHLPLEDAFLRSVIPVGGWINVPAPELELCILSMRALLKYRDRDAFKDMLSIRSPGLPGHIRNELNWLVAQVSEATLEQMLTGHADVLPSAAIRHFLAAFRANPRAGFTFWGLRGQIRRSLGRYQRRGRLLAMLTYFRELWRRQVLTRFRPARGMTLPGRGVTISLLGADGAGKSTLSRELVKWLGWRMDIQPHYLGSKQPSFLSSGYYRIFRAFRRGQTEATRRLSATNGLVRALNHLKRFFLYQHFLAVGRDRHGRYVIGNQQAQAGSIVLFDRFPFESPLDGPEIEHMSEAPSDAMTVAFSRRERDLYSRFSPPDHLIILDVTPEVSARRKPDHSLETIQSKKRALAQLETQLQASPVKWTKVNADLPLEDVLLQLKRAIWTLL